MFVLDGYVIDIAEHEVLTSNVQHDALERDCALADNLAAKLLNKPRASASPHYRG
jgi:hypothetical protein